MRVESLNIWGGRVFDPLMDFLQEQAKTVDVFCLQEVYDTTSDQKHTRAIVDPKKSGTITNAHSARANVYTEIKVRLSDFQGFFHPVQDQVDFHGEVDYDLHFGQATFVRRGIPVMKTGDIFVHGERNGMRNMDWETLGRNLQFTQIEHNGQVLTIANFHGIHGNGKEDTQSRIDQAKRVRVFLDEQEGEKILCGDFNLLPDTQSLAIMEESLINLVKEYKVPSTRSHYYDKPIPFADYMIVSPGLTIVDFRVLQKPVSDHLPLQLDFK